MTRNCLLESPLPQEVSSTSPLPEASILTLGAQRRMGESIFQYSCPMVFIHDYILILARMVVYLYSGVLVALLCPTLCNPMDCGPPGSSVWARMRSGLPCPPPGDLLDPGIKLASLMSPALAGRFFTI